MQQYKSLSQAPGVPGQMSWIATMGAGFVGVLITGVMAIILGSDTGSVVATEVLVAGWCALTALVLACTMFDQMTHHRFPQHWSLGREAALTGALVAAVLLPLPFLFWFSLTALLPLAAPVALGLGVAFRRVPPADRPHRAPRGNRPLQRALQAVARDQGALIAEAGRRRVTLPGAVGGAGARDPMAILTQIVEHEAAAVREAGPAIAAEAHAAAERAVELATWRTGAWRAILRLALDGETVSAPGAGTAPQHAASAAASPAPASAAPETRGDEPAAVLLRAVLAERDAAEASRRAALQRLHAELRRANAEIETIATTLAVVACGQTLPVEAERGRLRRLTRAVDARHSAQSEIAAVLAVGAIDRER